MTEYLFSYGTLQKEQVQKELFARTLIGASDTLSGYRVATIEIMDESFVSKSKQRYHLQAVLSDDKNDSIKGTVFEVTTEELLLADKYEPDGYKRIKVVLGSGKKAWIYVATGTP